MKKQGQALVEYILIISIICIIVIALVSYFGGRVKDSITKSTCNILGDEFVKGKKPGEAKCISLDELEEETSK